MDCLFCKIIKREVPAEVIYEDENTLAFLDIHPRAPGHTMVLPKIHAETIIDLPDGGEGLLFKAVKNITEKLIGRLAPDGFTIGINHGQAAGQAVEHLHVHIIPRYKNDGGGSIHSVVQNPGGDNLLEIKNRIVGRN